MPASKKYARKKRQSKSAPSKGKVVRAARSRNPFDMPISQAAKYAWTGVKSLYSLVNSELYKYDINAQTSTLYSDGSTCVHLTAIAQGDGDAARTGNSIFVKNVSVKGVVSRSTAGDVVQSCAFALVQDQQGTADGTAISWSNVFESANPHAFINSDTAGRFKVLRRIHFELDTVKTLSKYVELTVPLEHHVRYNGTASTDVYKGQIYLIMISSQATSNQPTYLYNSRTSYHDN